MASPLTIAFGTFAEGGTGNVHWDGVTNVASSNDVRNTCVLTGSSQNTYKIICTNIDSTGLPKNATIDGLGFYTEMQRNVAQACTAKAQVYRAGSGFGTTQTRSITSTGTDATVSIPSSLPSFTDASVCRGDFLSSTFGFWFWVQCGASAVTPAVDYLYGSVYYTERTPSNLTATAEPHRIRLNWDRITDWATATTGLQAGTGETQTEHWRWQVAISTDNFSTTLEDYIVPSVADSGGHVADYANFEVGTEPTDAEEFRWPCTAADNGTTYYFRVRLAHVANDGTIDEYGPWSSTASAAYDSSGESPILAEALNPLPCPDISTIRFLFGFLHGGSAGNTTASVEEKLGINTSFATSNSIPLYTADLMRTVEASSLASPFIGGFGFWDRAPGGVNAEIYQTTPSQAWLTYLNLQGGRLDPTFWSSSWSAVGGGSSPGMLLPVDTFAHSTALGAGTTKTQMLSITGDMDEYLDVQSPILFYFSPWALAHTQRSDVNILVATGLHAILNRGIIPLFDVAGTEPLYDPEYGSDDFANPSLRLYNALNAAGYVTAFETVSSGKSEWWDAAATRNVHDNQAFDLYFNDSGYNTAKKTALGAAVDMLSYIKSTSPAKEDLTNPPRAGYRFICRLSNNTCSYCLASATSITSGTDSSGRFTRQTGIGSDKWNFASGSGQGLLPGDKITTSGYANAGNNGTFTVVAVTATTLQVAEATVANESAAAGRSVILSPEGQMIRALEVAKDLWDAYGLTVLPCFENQTQWDGALEEPDLVTAFATFMDYTGWTPGGGGPSTSTATLARNMGLGVVPLFHRPL